MHFDKVFQDSHVTIPRLFNMENNPAYPPAVAALKENSDLPEEAEVRQKKFLNNLIEQDHQVVKRRFGPFIQLDGIVNVMAMTKI